MFPRNDSEHVADHYDILGDLYLRLWGARLHHGLWETGRESLSEALAAMERLIVAQAELAPELKIYDIGCGYGELAQSLAREWDARVEGWTLSSTQAEEARRRVMVMDASAPKPVFHCQDWLEAETERGSADVIFAIESLSHINEAESFFQRAWQSLRNGGRLVIADWWRPEKCRSRISSLLLSSIARSGAVSPFRTMSQAKTMSSAQGFSLSRELDLTASVSPTWRVFSRRAWSLLARDPKFRSKVFRLRDRAPELGLTLYQLRLAYAIGTLRYGLLSLKKESQRTHPWDETG
ncbi:MAG: class I SAM-dependent methyltransferase [Verrucomicrobiota bacterium]